MFSEFMSPIMNRGVGAVMCRFPVTFFVSTLPKIRQAGSEEMRGYVFEKPEFLSRGPLLL